MKVSRTTSIKCCKSGVPRQNPTIVEEDYNDFVRWSSDTEESPIKF